MEYDLSYATIRVHDGNGRELLAYQIVIDTSAKAIVQSELAESHKAVGAIHVVSDWTNPLTEFLLEALARRVKELTKEATKS